MASASSMPSANLGTGRRRLTTLKKILSAGKGNLPDFRKDTKAIFHYEVFLPPKAPKIKEEESLEPEEAQKRIFPEDRSVYKCVDSSKLAPPDGYGKPLELVFGKKFQLPLFEDCLKTMLINEISQFDVYEPRELLTFPMVAKKLRDIARAEIDPEFARKLEHSQRHQCAATVTDLGYPELDALLKEGPRPMRVVLHLLEVMQPEDYAVDNWQMDEAQRSAQVDTLKAEGNRRFGQKDFPGASEKYREALTLLDQLLLKEKPGDPEWLELDARNVPLYLNLAQCFLNMGKFYDAANCADEALKREPENGKALYRRAKAQIGKWELDEAEADLKRLAIIGQEPVLVERTMEELEQKRREKRQQEERAYKAMFQGIVGPSTEDKEEGKSS